MLLFAAGHPSEQGQGFPGRCGGDCWSGNSRLPHFHTRTSPGLLPPRWENLPHRREGDKIKNCSSRLHYFERFRYI